MPRTCMFQQKNKTQHSEPKIHQVYTRLSVYTKRNDDVGGVVIVVVVVVAVVAVDCAVGDFT